MRYLSLDDVLRVAEVAIGAVVIRDIGLLDAAVNRPRTTVFGQDAYPSLELKVASLAHSIARNHALVDGDKRLALAGAIAMFGINGRRLTLTNDEAYGLIMGIATGELEDVVEIAAALTTEAR